MNTKRIELEDSVPSNDIDDFLLYCNFSPIYELKVTVWNLIVFAVQSNVFILFAYKEAVSFD